MENGLELIFQSFVIALFCIAISCLFFLSNKEKELVKTVTNNNYEQHAIYMV